MGEFLGSPEGLGNATMHAYIDQEDFAEQSIDEALRQLLGGFRLPGGPFCDLCMFKQMRVDILKPDERPACSAPCRS